MKKVAESLPGGIFYFLFFFVLRSDRGKHRLQLNLGLDYLRQENENPHFGGKRPSFVSGGKKPFFNDVKTGGERRESGPNFTFSFATAM